VKSAPYSATGDGATDDTAAVASAVAAAAGKTLYFPSGTYRVDRVLVTSTMAITGDGPTSILNPRTLTTEDYPTFDVRANNVKISALKIDGNGVTNEPSDFSDAYNNGGVPGNNYKTSAGFGRGFRAGIRAEAVSGLTVTNMEFTNIPGAAIATNGSSQITISDNWLHDSFWELAYIYGSINPFALTSGQNVVITDNTVDDVHAPAAANGLGINPDAIVISRMNGGVISGNAVDGIDRCGMKLESIRNINVMYNTTTNATLDYPGIQLQSPSVS
jgi:hypothetical protein